MKLMFRVDEAAWLVRASFAKMDGTDAYAVATLNANLARKCPGLCDAWRKALADAFAHAMKQAGADVRGVHWWKPHDRN
jgi:hypothetical protein